MEGAESADWKAVRRELDRTRQTVIDTMDELRDHEFAELVSIGGWLGGTRALSALVTEQVLRRCLGTAQSAGSVSADLPPVSRIAARLERG